MDCKFLWFDLPKQIKDKIFPFNNVLSEEVKDIKWFDLPNRLDKLCSELEVINPSCKVENHKFLWFDLPNRLNYLCSLLNCQDDNSYNLSITFDNLTTIFDQNSFKNYLIQQGLTNIIINNFSIINNILRCNLYFDTIDTIAFTDLQITNVNKFEAFYNIKNIFLSNNKITNIQALNNFVNLESIWLDGNLISEIGYIENLVNLKTLNLNSNNITELKNINTLVNLESLYLAQNNINIINDISELNKINLLTLNNNNISTLQFNNLNTWAENVLGIGNINTSNNISDFSLSTTYTTLTNKSWVIT